MDKALFSFSQYVDDDIRAVDAKALAQTIAFSPLTFQAVRTLLDLDILRHIEEAGDDGITRQELAEQSHVSNYGVDVLCDIALGMGLAKVKSAEEKERLVLGKLGWMFLEDELTQVNLRFVHDVCYKGAYYLCESIQSGKPKGLEVFGPQWTSVYEALSSLPPHVQKSWFAFDHFYSDIAFPEALPIVFAQSPRTILDIGGNTAKWAIACCRYDVDVQVTIVDLPGQTAVAQKRAQEAGFADRIHIHTANILSAQTALPPAPDAVWMSQFLDCFSLEEVTDILRKVHSSANESTAVYVLEPLWDKQRFSGAAYSLQATSLYFTCMANGTSKMYRCQELVEAVERAGFSLRTAHHNLGSNSYSLLVFYKR